MGQGASLVDYDPRDGRAAQELQLQLSAYPNRGLYADKELSLSELTQLPQAEQMRFSDAVTRRYALNPRFRRLQEAALRRQSVAALALRTTATGLGNIAFLAHWNPNSFWTRHYQELLAELR